MATRISFLITGELEQKFFAALKRYSMDKSNFIRMAISKEIEGQHEVH